VEIINNNRVTRRLRSLAMGRAEVQKMSIIRARFVGVPGGMS
jgi:hypothetical protein